MDDEFLDYLMELTNNRHQKSYSEAEAKAIGKELRKVVSQPTHKSHPSTVTTLQSIARFLESSKGFEIREWHPEPHQGQNKGRPPDDTRVREVKKFVIRRMKELEEPNHAP